MITGNYASTTAATSQAKTPTLQDIERVAKMLEAMPPEPIGEWMRQQGCPPEQWRVVLPASLRDKHGPALWPDYVVFSSVIDKPVFMARVLPWAPFPAQARMMSEPIDPKLLMWGGRGF